MDIIQIRLNCSTILKVFCDLIKRKLAELHRLRYVLASKEENPKLKRHFDTRPYLTLLDTSNGASRGLNFYLTLRLTPRHYIPRRDNLDSGRTRSTPPPPVGSACRRSPRSRGSKRGTATAQPSQVRPSSPAEGPTLLLPAESKCGSGDVPRQTVHCTSVCLESFNAPPALTPPTLLKITTLRLWRGEEGLVFPSSLLHCGFHPCTFFIYIITWSFN